MACINKDIPKNKKESGKSTDINMEKGGSMEIQLWKLAQDS